MYVILTSDESRAWVDVALKDGCELRVGSCNLDASSVEPVPWFKVCLLESVSVDVAARSLSWTVREAQTPSATSLPVSVSSPDEEGAYEMSRVNVLSEDELKAGLEDNLEYDTSVIDQIFDHCSQLLEDVMTNTPPSHVQWLEQQHQFGRLLDSQEHIETVVQILHSHLLPVVKLSEDDIPAIQFALEEQQASIDKLGRELVQQAKQETSYEASLANLRNRVVPGVKASLKANIFNREFLERLFDDVNQRGLVNTRQLIDSRQREVERCKSALELGDFPDEDLKADLDRARLLRDESNALLMEMLDAREAIHNRLDQKRADSGKLLPAQRSYLQAWKVYNAHHLQSQRLMDAKIAALGIREVMSEAVAGLEDKRSSLDVERANIYSHLAVEDTNRPLTASLRRVRKDLLPLKEALAQLLADPNHEISQLHSEFVRELSQIYHEKAMPLILTYGVPQAGTTVPDGGQEPGPRSTRYTKQFEVLDPAKDMVEHIGAVIENHIGKMVKKLQTIFHNSSGQLERKLYLSYERVLYLKIGHMMNELYTIWSQKTVNQLLRVSQSVENKSFGEVKSFLSVKSPWWLFLFEPFDRSHTDGVEGCSSPRQEPCFSPEAPLAPFQRHFAPAAQSLLRLMGTVRPLNKAQCLTAAVKHITEQMDQLSKQYNDVSQRQQIGSDDLVPVVILFLLYVKPEVLACLCMNCFFLHDLMAPFLSNGIEGFALVQFHGAIQIISGLLEGQ